ncbi:nucleotidyltransferase domain-containing protein [Spirulina sp. CS-785/01]|uniref:nucleotidyltransferase domain-containing protein n=1 Tax=Spirulina sp. CS-785/01 TaxID=3021716 RepID=UPI00232BBD00|nr:nucleotidyltransferase domain-containing protein [Spirulina sp. CS-785/01]MDB9311775.1 nucleotidyltransferase domain-containing protein [Spirulina sp. CS-785/01]
MTHPDLSRILTQIRQGLEKLYGTDLECLILYGSQARGDAEQDSDIDLLILLKRPFVYGTESDRISELVANLCLEYAVVICCTFATVQKYQTYDSGFFRNIRQEGVTV